MDVLDLGIQMTYQAFKWSRLYADFELFRFRVPLVKEDMFWLWQNQERYLGMPWFHEIFWNLVISTVCNIFFSSWGDGEHGKLGHGTTDRVRKPKIISGIKSKGPLVREWHQVSAGFKHSAIVTNDGKYFTYFQVLQSYTYCEKLQIWPFLRHNISIL